MLTIFILSTVADTHVLYKMEIVKLMITTPLTKV